VGKVTATGKLLLRMHGEVAAEMPVGPLVSEAPVYERPWVETPHQSELYSEDVPAFETMAALTTLIGCPDLASKRWIWEQYDHLVMGNTVQRPGGDAAVVRLPGKRKALALVTDCTPRYCHAEPRRGGAQAVAESWRNLTAVGATPIALTDNMNFGNPERPEIMGQFAQCIEGMREACLALDYPVVSGNVSLYNETNGSGIWPAPVIGGVGLIDDAAKSVNLAFKRPGEAILLVGATRGHLGSSLYLREIAGVEGGAPPPVDLAAERRNGDAVRREILAGRVSACHDLSDGGLLVALAEMAMASGVGASVAAPSGAAPHAFWFGEDQGRYVLTTSDPEDVAARLAASGAPVLRLGVTGGASLTVEGAGAISTAELRRINEAWLPAFMAAP
jgi:phosphoribosylformylglycinamidine synthase